MKRSAETTNRVWIELEAHNDDARNVARAEYATNLIRRLGSTAEITWSTEGQTYIFRREGGEFTELADSGHWFNLEFFGRPL